MYDTSEIWAKGLAGLTNLNEDAWSNDEPGADTSWDNEDTDAFEGDPGDSLDEASIDAAIAVWESGVSALAEESSEIIEDHPDGKEAKPVYPNENDAFKNDPTKDDGVPDLMKDDNSTEEVEIESSLW